MIIKYRTYPDNIEKPDETKHKCYVESIETCCAMISFRLFHESCHFLYEVTGNEPDEDWPIIINVKQGKYQGTPITLEKCIDCNQKTILFLDDVECKTFNKWMGQLNKKPTQKTIKKSNMILTYEKSPKGKKLDDKAYFLKKFQCCCYEMSYNMFFHRYIYDIGIAHDFYGELWPLRFDFLKSHKNNDIALHYCPHCGAQVIIYIAGKKCTTREEWEDAAFPELIKGQLDMIYKNPDNQPNQDYMSNLKKIQSRVINGF